MKKEQEIRDFYHRKLGSIETDTVTGNKVGFDFYHRVVGSYDKKMDVTMNFYHQIVSHGDTLSNLIVEANNK